MGAVWRSAWGENRDRFAADREKDTSRYGGCCACSVAHGNIAEIDPEGWKVVDDELDLNCSEDVQADRSEDIPGNISRGDADRPTIQADLDG